MSWRIDIKNKMRSLSPIELVMVEQSNREGGEETLGAGAEALRLHIGGSEVKEGWKIMDVREGPGVDFVGDCRDLSRFASESVEIVYASHVYEHVSYLTELPAAFCEVHRVLKPGGLFYVSVPDLAKLCELFLRPDMNGNMRYKVMRMMFGGQTHEHDFHRAGLTMEFVEHLLGRAKFRRAERVETFGLFEDTSILRFYGELISLNVVATK